MSYTLYK